MIVLFIDVLVILRRYRPQFAARPLARPVVFWVCAALGAVSSLVGIVATLSGSQTPLISNNAGSITVWGATVSYGLWFYLVAGITIASLTVGVMLYLIGGRTAVRATAAEPALFDVAGHEYAAGTDNRADWVERSGRR